jgi:hypothetical protein
MLKGPQQNAVGLFLRLQSFPNIEFNFFILFLTQEDLPAEDPFLLLLPCSPSEYPPEDEH